jgi:hypothetical protein
MIIRHPWPPPVIIAGGFFMRSTHWQEPQQKLEESEFG